MERLQRLACQRELAVRFVGLARFLLFVTTAISFFPAVVRAQQDRGNYIRQIGAPVSVTPHPVELGFVNVGNGNLHLEVPVGSFPQRGSTAPLTLKFVYDSRIWRHFG